MIAKFEFKNSSHKSLQLSLNHVLLQFLVKYFFKVRVIQGHSRVNQVDWTQDI